MKNRLRDLTACGCCLLGGAASTVLGQLLLDDQPEAGFWAIVVGLVLIVTGMGIALFAIGFEVLHPRPDVRTVNHLEQDGVAMDQQPRRWRPWAEFIFFSFMCAYAVYLAVYEHSIWGWSLAVMSAGVVIFTGWQLLAVWRTWP